jgi:predicted DNA-binding protein
MLVASESRRAGLTIQIPPEESERIEQLSARTGMSAREWIESLVSAHIHQAPPWTLDDLGSMDEAANAIKQILSLTRNSGPEDADCNLADKVLTAFLDRVSQAADRRRRYWGIEDAPQSATGVPT